MLPKAPHLNDSKSFIRWAGKRTPFLASGKSPMISWDDPAHLTFTLKEKYKSHYRKLGRKVCQQTHDAQEERRSRKLNVGLTPKLPKIRPVPPPKQIEGTKKESLLIEKTVLRKGKEKHATFLICSQIFKCKLRVITRRPDSGKTDSINRLARNPCYCTKAALAPWSQFNFESLLSENNGMCLPTCANSSKGF